MLEIKNKSYVSEFILVGFSVNWIATMTLFILFLLIYTIILSGNLLVIILIWKYKQLHAPMYLFLAVFSFMEILMANVVIPESLKNFLSLKRNIPAGSCFTQSFFYFLIGTSDFILLSVMSYDRYVAICNPLHYSTIMTWKRSICLIIASWLGGLLSISLPTFLKLRLPYCGPNKINHFFCDAVPLVKLACADTTHIQLIDFFLFSLVILGSLILVFYTYICILIVVLRISSTNGRKKAFSTCSSHFFIISLSYVSSIFIYVTPTQGKSLEINKLLSIVTTFITPVMSPFIWTLRNQQIRGVLLSSMKNFKPMVTAQCKW
ncbi:hypothetical protein XELAEV_18007355mg [Xenopus laevis]|uniref:Olfactory receptor n=1 Tax=Xenopus laevis TaxID=8355 RepID=A0A974E0Z4_XENLA|nr:hypothetical protein XELAEV_18007355mg [Xenopus laevis]